MNKDLFKTVRVVSGSVEWQGEIDLSYDTLYLESKPVKADSGNRKNHPAQKKKLAALPNKKVKQTRVSVE